MNLPREGSERKREWVHSGPAIRGTEDLRGVGISKRPTGVYGILQEKEEKRVREKNEGRKMRAVNTEMGCD